MIVLGNSSEPMSFSDSEIASMPAVKAIRDRGQMRVLINSYTPRLAHKPNKDEPVVGLEIDLLRMLARAIFSDTKDLDGCIDLVEAENSVKIDLLADNEIDLIVANLFDTPERRQRIDFAGHYLSARYSPIIRNDSPDIVDISDLNGLRIAVDAGSEDERILARLAPDSELTPMDNPDAWIEALLDNRVDAFWGDTVVDSYYAQHSDGRIRQCSLKAGVGHAAVGVSKNRTDLRQYVNHFSEHLLSTGQLASLLRRWGL